MASLRSLVALFFPLFCSEVGLRCLKDMFSKTWLDYMLAWGAPGPPCHRISKKSCYSNFIQSANLNERGQPESSFGWRATRLMSLRGFQLLHLRSKRRKRLLLPFFSPSLTFSTLTSIDRGGWWCWGVARESRLSFCSFLSYVMQEKLVSLLHATLASFQATCTGEEGILLPERHWLWLRETL